MIKVGHEFEERQYPSGGKFQFCHEFPYAELIVGEYHLNIDWQGHTLKVRTLNQEDRG